MFVRIFTSMGRLPQLKKYYHKCQKDILLKKWRDQLEIEQEESVVQWMHNYYNFLLSNWHTQCKWFNQVFINELAVDIFIDIYIDVLSSLDPSINECTDAGLKQVADKLALLHELKETVKQFANNLIKLIDLGKLFQQKKYFQILKINNLGKVDKDKILQLMQAVYNPMVKYVGKFAAYQQANLMNQVSTLNCMKEELPDTIQALGLSIPHVIDICRDAKKQCIEITENCGYCGLLIALRAFLMGYADLYRVALRQIDRSKKQDEDWSTFQMCLSLLQYTGEVLVNLQHLERDLTGAILEINQKDHLIDFKFLLLDSSDLKEFESLVKCVTEGTKLSLLDHVTSEFGRLCSDIHHTTYQVVFAPISVHLDVVQSPKTWAQFTNSTLHNSDLPDYSFTPQEYITQVNY